MAGKDGAPKVGLHPLVQALVPDPAKPPQRALKLLGLPGVSPSAGETRLWLDADLTSYVDVPDDTILYAKELPDDAGTILWVTVEANLTYGSVSSHTTQAGFLGGAIASAHLAGAAPGQGPIGPMATPPTFPSGCGPCPTQLGPCVSLPVCPSTPSQCGPCPTQFGPCASQPFCPTADPMCHTVVVCPSLTPSQCGPCQTQPPICPPLTQAAACQPSQLGRCISHFAPCASQVNICPPTHTGACPSVHVLCPTPSARVQCPSAAPCQSVQVLCPAPSALVRCPTQLCPSVSVPCLSSQACPTTLCPPESLACGGPGGGFGPVA
jgi:hypothetical protein